MKRIIMAVSAIGVLGILMTALSLGGSTGCGSSSGGGGGGTTAATAEEQATASRLLTGFGASASESENPALAVLKAGNGAALKTQTISCPLGGTFTISGSSFTYSACAFTEGVTITGTVTFTSTADSATLTYNDTIFSLDGCGDFTVDGTIAIVGSDVTIDMTATGSGETTNFDGTLTVNSDETISGTVTITGGAEITCVFDRTDPTVCPDTAAACGMDESAICEGDAYGDFCAFVTE